MLRYFYLLCLISFIKETICYNHARSYKHLKPKHFGKRTIKIEDLNNEKNNQNVHIIKRRQGYGNLNENDFTQIDVASFIQKPDSYADDDRIISQQYDFKNQLIPKHFTDYEDLNKIISKLNMKDDNLNVDEQQSSKHDSVLLKDLNYLSTHNLEESPNNSGRYEFQKDFKDIFKNEIDPDNLLHNPHKKRCHWNCSLKFPFFFRKENYSRNIKYLNDTKKQQRTVDITDYIDLSSNDDVTQKGINKRANKETSNLKIKTENVKTKNDKRCFGQSLFHNSRQYYQRLMSDSNTKKMAEPKQTGKKDNESNEEESSTKTKTLRTTQSTNHLNKDDKKLFNKRKGNIRKKLLKRKKYNEG